MNRQPSELETTITSLAHSFAIKLDELATGDFLREGVIKEAITTLMWEIYHQMPDQRAALSEALENWPEIIRDEITKDSTSQ